MWVKPERYNYLYTGKKRCTQLHKGIKNMVGKMLAKSKDAVMKNKRC